MEEEPRVEIPELELLYNLEPGEVALMLTMTYPDALMFFKQSAKTLLADLVAGSNYLDRDDFRINKVSKAIKHNSKKLLELGITTDYKVYLPKKKKSKETIIIHKNQTTLDDFN